MFLELLTRRNRDEKWVSHRASERDYAPKVFLDEEDEVRETHLDLGSMERAMKFLLDDNQIHWVAYRSSSRHKKHRLLVGPAHEGLFS